ncbi:MULTISPECIES: hypothetical protein [Neobacillus]|uniref:Methionine gamma-lyase n=1 Tax=Neobacillus rhizophilus TaxID=2833579 RepID=A0A942U7Z1_9BACI|nr:MULTISPECIES: hypothetical protein [Neobacillus]MBS4214298.1 hypothetical protein [Neobacillus rhizophilus]MBU8915908.1 hypothetical protein [Bacillus sp. FJAT-29953]
MNYSSKLVKVNKDPGHCSHISPVYMTSTFVFDNAEVGSSLFSIENYQENI